VRVAYVMMVHSMHRAAAWRRVPCAAQLCAGTDTLAWLLYRASAAVPKLINYFDFAKTLEENNA